MEYMAVPMQGLDEPDEEYLARAKGQEVEIPDIPEPGMVRIPGNQMEAVIAKNMADIQKEEFNRKIDNVQASIKNWLIPSAFAKTE